jgi:hypothetical protein
LPAEKVAIGDEIAAEYALGGLEQDGQEAEERGGDFMAHSAEQWAECKRKCRLNDEDIAIAKRFGLNPRNLIKNIPGKSEPWKAPVKVWLREIEAKHGK